VALEIVKRMFDAEPVMAAPHLMVYAPVLDDSVRDAAERVGSKLITIGHTAREVAADNSSTGLAAGLDSSTLVPSAVRNGVSWRQAPEPNPRIGFWLAALDDFRNWLIQEAA
jgi:hypothetical protein